MLPLVRTRSTHQSMFAPALQALGPEAVLAALPLNLAEGLAGTGEARTWLLPLLRMHVRGARLGYWGKVLLPLARELGARAAAAARSAMGATASGRGVSPPADAGPDPQGSAARESR